MAKITISDLTAAFAATTALNSRFQQIEDELNNKVLYRANPIGEPNAMQNIIDMGAFKITNLADPVNPQDAATRGWVGTGVTGIVDAAYIKTNYEVNADTNAFDDAAVTKLAGIETLADVTDATNVQTAGAIMDSEITPSDGLLRKTGAATYTTLKINTTATTTPGIGSDSANGYGVGSVWINVTTDNAYICLDSTVGAAIWAAIATTSGAVASVLASLPITATAGANPTISINAATTIAAGSMSAADKTKIDGNAATIPIADAGSYIVATNVETALQEFGVLLNATPGTAAASKAPILDANRDISNIRNLGITGTFTGTIADGTVSTTAKLTDGIITLAKMNIPVAGNVVIKRVCGSTELSNILNGYSTYSDFGNSASNFFICNVLVAGQIRIAWKMRCETVTTHTSYARVMVNGVASGAEQSTTSITMVDKSVDITVAVGDLIVLQTYDTGPSSDGVFISNVEVRCSSSVLAVS